MQIKTNITIKDWLLIPWVIFCFAVGWLLCAIFIPGAAFAQSVTGGQISPNIPPVVAQKNVTIVYNVATGQPDMVIIDANDLTDPAWNPPGTRQVRVPIATYRAIPDPDTFQTYMSNAITSDIAAQVVP